MAEGVVKIDTVLLIDFVILGPFLKITEDLGFALQKGSSDRLDGVTSLE